MDSHNIETMPEITINLIYRQDICAVKKQMKEMAKKDNKIILSFIAIGRDVLRIEVLANDPYDLSRLYISFAFEKKGIPVVVQDTENYDYKKLLSTYSYFNDEVIGIVEKYTHIAINYMKKFNNYSILSFLNGTQVGDILNKGKSLIWPITNKARIELRINKKGATIIGFLNGNKIYSDLVDMDVLSDPKYDGRQILQSIIILMVYKIYKRDLHSVDKNTIEDIISGIIEDFEVLEN